MPPTNEPSTSTSERAKGDNRRLGRRRVLKAAIVAFNDRRSTLPCAVRDITDIGARLRVDGTVRTPEAFDLIVELDGLEASCEVIWRRGGEIGVRFLGPPRQVAPKRAQVIKPLLPPEPPASLRRKPKERSTP